MPGLSREHLTQMRSVPPKRCDACAALVVLNYCRQCDEYFEAGHHCPGEHQKHVGHRTY